MIKKIDNFLSLLFKPLFFAWLLSLILFVLFRNYSAFVYWLFVTLTVIYAAVILYAVYSLIRLVREIMDEEDNY